MCTSSPIQRVTSSFEDGASAREATSANSVRSTRLASNLRPRATFLIAVSIPSRRHS